MYEIDDDLNRPRSYMYSWFYSKLASNQKKSEIFIIFLSTPVSSHANNANRDESSVAGAQLASWGTWRFVDLVVGEQKQVFKPKNGD